MDSIWAIVSSFALICTFLTTVRVSLQDPSIIPKNRYLRFMTHTNWCFAVWVMFIPWIVAEFGEGHTSPLPWKAFSANYSRHGFADGMLMFFLVLMVDIWLFFTPASWYIHRHKLSDEKAKYARIFNILIGLVLVTPHNPFYWVIKLLVSSSHE